MSGFGQRLKDKIGSPSQWFGDLTRTPVWKSLFRHKLPTDPKNRALVVLTNVFLPLHPLRMRKPGMRISYTWCMGGISFFLFLSLTVTGILLMFYYRPTAQHAYPDMLEEGLEPHRVREVWVMFGSDDANEHVELEEEDIEKSIAALKANRSQVSENVEERVREWKARNGEKTGFKYSESFRVFHLG